MSYIQGNVILYTKFVVVHLLSFNNDICLKFEIIELVIGTGRYMHALSAIGLSVMIYISTSLTIHLIILQLIQDCEMIFFFMARRPIPMIAFLRLRTMYIMCPLARAGDARHSRGFGRLMGVARNLVAKCLHRNYNY